MSRIGRLAVCTTALLAPSTLQAQLLTPTAPSTVSAGPASQTVRAFPHAWLRVAVGKTTSPPGARSIAAVVDVIMRSDRGERVLSSTPVAAHAAVGVGTTGAKVRLVDLPTGLPFVLRISTYRRGVVCSVYTQTSRLQLPDTATVARLGSDAAIEQSGFLGDFVIDPADGTIRVTDASPR
jgi:hypothetical protein